MTSIAVAIREILRLWLLSGTVWGRKAGLQLHASAAW